MKSITWGRQGAAAEEGEEGVARGRGMMLCYHLNIKSFYGVAADADYVSYINESR